MGSTELAKAERGPTSGIHPAAKDPPKPVLASEVLREELAPLQPARRQCRVWLVGLALSLAALSVALRLGVGMPGGGAEAATLGFSAAGALLAVALLPFPYALRAGVVLVIGVSLMVLGARGAGPLAGMSVDGGSWRVAARLLAMTALPAALLLRAHYRAYARARQILAVAMLLSVPFLASEVMLSLNASAPLILRIAATVNVAVVLCGLFGFMGESTTGASTLWALLVLAVLPVEVGLRELTHLSDGATGYLTYPATAIGMLCVALLTSLGVFQLLAAGLAPEARRLSLLPRVSAPSPESGTGPKIA